MVELDPRLAADTVAVADLSLSSIRLMNRRAWPWLILVPRRQGAVELLDLSAADRGLLIEEVARCAEVIRRLASPNKLNVGALGNIVAQLHVHVVGRFRGDPAWPGPVWGAAEASPYADPPAEAARFARALSKA